jgi:hypothetical protein
MKAYTTSHCIEAYPNTLDPEVCNNIISILEAKIEAGIVEYNDDQSDAYGNRTDIQLYAQNHGGFKRSCDEIKESLEGSWKLYVDKYWPGTQKMKDQNVPFDRVFCPEIKIQKSEPGGGYCAWHCEQGGGSLSNRFAVWMIYLNDVEDGGRTDFYHQDVSVSPTLGTTVIWPAGPSHFHRSSPDLKENKYIATGWFVYEAFTIPVLA